MGVWCSGANVFFSTRVFLKPLFDLFLTMLSRSRFNCCWFKTKIFILKSRREDCQKKLLEPNLACSTYFAQQGQKLFELSFKFLLMNSWGFLTASFSTVFQGIALYCLRLTQVSLMYCTSVWYKLTESSRFVQCKWKVFLSDEFWLIEAFFSILLKSASCISLVQVKFSNSCLRNRYVHVKSRIREHPCIT